MDFTYIKKLIEDNPAIKILRSRNPALILGFLYQSFKKNHTLIITNENLIINLAAYLEENDPTEEPDTLERSRLLIEEWCNDHCRYLRKYPDAQGTVVHELTTHTEKVLRWIESLQPREYIGTESRFSDILRRLEELVARTTEDPKQKIEDLKRKKLEIEEEIQSIENSGTVETLAGWQIQERIEDISNSARDLLADFKEVELNFKKIVEHIYEEEIEKNPNRGEILGYTLDANNQLKESPQGKSFNAFMRFLIMDAGENKIKGLMDKVTLLLKERSLSYQDNFLKKLKYHLYQAGQRIVESNHMLADKLNRVLTESSLLQRQRIKELIREIKKIVFSIKDRTPDDEAFMEIEGDPEIHMDLERPLVWPQIDELPEEIVEAENLLLPGNFTALFDQFFVDKKRLQMNIRQMLGEKHEVSLEEILARFPIQEGLAEIIYYYDLASTTKKASILADKHFFIVYAYRNITKKFKAPEVIFYR